MNVLVNPMRRASAAFLFVAAAGLVGCGSVTPGTTVAKYTRGADPGPPVAVTQGGTYALYYTTDTTPQVRTPVREGERVGFDTSSGTVDAVAGEYRKPIGKDVYKAFWKHVKE